MNKYVLMLAAAGLIAAAPAYYAFQAQAEEAAPVAGETSATSPTDEVSTDEATQDSATTESAADTKKSPEGAAE